MELLDRKEIFGEDKKYFEFVLRLLWLRCHMLLSKNLAGLVINTLHQLLAVFDQFPEFDAHVVCLKNSKKHNVIKREIVNQFLLLQSEYLLLYGELCYHVASNAKSTDTK
jgi:hypothetical protein